MKLEEIYARHPLSERTILARLARQGISVNGHLTEWNLAVDVETDVTDQNHTGGVQAILELATAAGVTSRSVVADVGAGLGGSARVLAQAFGCRVVGIERDPRRYHDATSLTARVHLDHLVAFHKQDALLEPPGLDRIDILWGQAAWVHFPDPGRFLDAWLPVLAPGGRVAMADAFVRETAESEEDARLMAALEDSWGAYLVPISTWIDALAARGYHTVHLEDRTAESVISFSRLERAAARWPSGDVTDDERESWRRAKQAFSKGLLAAYQLVAVASSVV